MSREIFLHNINNFEQNITFNKRQEDLPAKRPVKALVEF